MSLSKDGAQIIAYMFEYNKQFGFGDQYSGARTIGNILNEFQREMITQVIWHEIKYLVEAGFLDRYAHPKDELQQNQYLKINVKGQGAHMDQQKPNSITSTVNVHGPNHGNIVGVGTQNIQTNNADIQATQALAEICKSLAVNSSERNARRSLELVDVSQASEKNAEYLSDAVDACPTVKERLLDVAKRYATSALALVITEWARAKGWLPPK